MIALLQTETERALADGYAALRVTGDMSWALRGIPGVNQLIQYEARLNTFFPGSRCLGLCQYDRRHFGDEALLDVLRTHPIAVIGSEVYSNFYYIPTADVLNGNLPSAELRCWFEHLASHRHAEGDLDALLRVHESTVATMPSSLLTLDNDLNILMANRSYLEWCGADASEIVGKNITETLPPELLAQQALLDRIREVAANGGQDELLSVEHAAQGRRDGFVNIRICGVHSPTGREGEPRIMLVLEDVTQHRQLEDQLRQAAKMETVGRLAGGVAHDFNNFLTGIKGYTDLLLRQFPEGAPAARDLHHISDLSDRAADLTRQLLAFSRKQPLERISANANDVVQNALTILRRLIGEHIDLSFCPASDAGTVKVDPTQIEQVLMNLAVNARDAMPEGGKLTIETANMTLDTEYASKHLSVGPGPYVMIAVSDTGVGIDEETLECIFEPFFTTKESGKGTGLGLATAYGVVKQHGGNIWVYSEEGQGTTFKIYLPRVDAPAELFAAPGDAESVPRGVETVLVVEDEEAVRDIAQRTLQHYGYTAIGAAHPKEAEVLFDLRSRQVDLVLTDVVMPGGSGMKLYESLLARRPGLKVLYMSGYTTNAIMHHGVLTGDAPFIQKPFGPAELARKIRATLDNGSATRVCLADETQPLRSDACSGEGLVAC